MRKKSFILVGSNNFWYASLANVSSKYAKKEAKAILKSCQEYEDPESGYCPKAPSKIFIYEILGNEEAVA